MAPGIFTWAKLSPCKKEAEPSGRDSRFCSQAKCRRLHPGLRGLDSVPQSVRISASHCIALSTRPHHGSERLRRACVPTAHAPTQERQDWVPARASRFTNYVVPPTPASKFKRSNWTAEERGRTLVWAGLTQVPLGLKILRLWSRCPLLCLIQKQL